MSRRDLIDPESRIPPGRAARHDARRLQRHPRHRPAPSRRPGHDERDRGAGQPERHQGGPDRPRPRRGTRHHRADLPAGQRVRHPARHLLHPWRWHDPRRRRR
ncbi:hypothetical protein ACFSTC_31755 [Nonomuraea ferruginea]